MAEESNFLAIVHGMVTGIEVSKFENDPYLYVVHVKAPDGKRYNITASFPCSPLQLDEDGGQPHKTWLQTIEVANRART